MLGVTEEKKKILKKYEEDVKFLGSIKVGTYEEAKKWVGKKGETYFVEEPVDISRIRFYCEMLEDDNPSYWDESYAKKQWGGLICPPGLMLSLTLPPIWRPKEKSKPKFLALEIPLPAETFINVETETEFFQPVYVGDYLNYQDEIIEITGEKKTHLGSGYFITFLRTIRNHKGEIVAKIKNVTFRFRVEEKWEK